ncbi:hypothetical protein HDU92_003604 [Lobulomyces angularis]|nr:hypothetical protein HDU92_003604 [Lobulomyces angularis]
MQSSNSILLVKPVKFYFNEEAARDNPYMSSTSLSQQELNEVVTKEFDNLHKNLVERDIEVTVFDSLESTPDSLFCNNWNSTHSTKETTENTLVLYPVKVQNRRLERRVDIIDCIKEKFKIGKVLDLSFHENEANPLYLESTGSIIFNRLKKTAYLALSERSSEKLFNYVSEFLGYKPISYHSFDKNGIPIYHTNCVMAIGTGYTVICLESIPLSERNLLTDQLKKDGLEIIDITLDQVSNFCGNCLEVTNSKRDKKFLFMSARAKKNLRPSQIDQILKYVNEIVGVDIETIENM